MLRRAFVAFILVVPAIASAQVKPAVPSIEGVWSVTSLVTTGANAVNNTKPQPNMVIFTKGGHYSFLSVNGTTSRPTFADAKDPAKLTDAEKLARFAQWNPFTANAGTYQVSGTTLTRRPTVAKNDTVMTTDPPQVAEFKIEGNKLTLVTKSAAGQPVSETRTTLMRVE